MSSPSGTASHTPHQSFWLGVMCLTGVDYFSTLGYQPSIAYKEAGLLAPLATVVLVLVTLFGALPVYRYVCERSFEGQGSIGMLAKLVSGWGGKGIVLMLLGFAATGFVITKTMSAADAAVHLIENPYWQNVFGAPPAESVTQPIVVTCLLLALLAAMFLRGFNEVIGLAAVIVAIYLVLNAIVVGSGCWYLLTHPAKLNAWWSNLRAGTWYLGHNPLHSMGGGPFAMMLVSLLLFPKLALGLSGFETGVAVMPNVKGDPDDSPKKPLGRIRNSKKLLLAAAAIMSVYLLGSSIVVSTLIPPDQITSVGPNGELPIDPKTGNVIVKSDDWPKKPATGRALAYMAHGEIPDAQAISPLFGNTFGTIYDLSTVVILWFAGASAMVGLLNLVPQYLPKYGMAPEWARAVRPLVFLFLGINLIVTFAFKANVDAQGGAYATGVLVLITSACFATWIDQYRQRQGSFWKRLPKRTTIITAIFVYTTIANELEKSFQGLLISLVFIVSIILTSIGSRVLRARELRFGGFQMADPQSKLLWDTIRELEITVLVPHRPGRLTLEQKEKVIRREHRIPRDLMIVFIEVDLSDTSEFVNDPVLLVREEGGRYVMKISDAASIAHTLAAVALEISKTAGRPPEIHFGWSDESPLSVSFDFLLFGEGNVPWMVRDLIRRSEPDEEKRPLVTIAGT